MKHSPAIMWKYRLFHFACERNLTQFLNSCINKTSISQLFQTTLLHPISCRTIRLISHPLLGPSLKKSFGKKTKRHGNASRQSNIATCPQEFWSISVGRFKKHRQNILVNTCIHTDIYFFKLRAFARTFRLCGYVLAAERLCIVYQCPALIIVHVVNKNLLQGCGFICWKKMV